MQCDALKETNEELRYSQMQQDHLTQAGIALYSEAFLCMLIISVCLFKQTSHAISGASRVRSHDNLAAEILPVEYR